MRTAAVFLFAAALVLSCPAAMGKDAVPTELDRVQQRRAVELSEHLRCLVCQNQTIADSNAELAQDLRRQVREQVAQGRTDAEIIAFMVQRYGDFVLYNPPLKPATLMLWFGPGVLLLVGLAVLVRNVRNRKRDAVPELGEEEHARASALLEHGAGKETD